MMHSTLLSRGRLAVLALTNVFVIAACGGGSSGGGIDNDPVVQPPPVTTAKIGLLFTDRPTDEFEQIKLNVTEAILIGGDSNDGQQVLFEGSEPIDLLKLTNFSEAIMFGEVEAGTYRKLRLRIDDLELVPMGGGPSQFPKLPANGKIDLLDRDGFEILPGRTLLIEIDMEANKALKITGAGNSGRYQFRPVVKVNIMDGDAGELPDKLARLEGTVRAINDDPAGSFVLCDIETPDSCVDVVTNMDTSIFDSDGAATDFGALMVDDPVVVIGNYTTDDDIVLNAVVVEIGGNAEQVKGNVVSDPADGEFLLDIADNGDIVVEQLPETKYYDADGMVGADAVVLGADVEVEGTRPMGDPDRIRAALIFVEGEEDEQAAGMIIEPVESATRSFGLTLAEGGDICVRVDEDADILLVDIEASEVTMGTFDDLAVDQVVDLFGVMNDCFDANEVIVDLNASPAP